MRQNMADCPCPKGACAFGWQINADGDCVLDWIETGGPRVKKPKRTGFGSKLIRTIDYDLGGTAELTYDPAGVSARFTFPGRHLNAVGKAPGAAVIPAQPLDLLSDRAFRGRHSS